MSLFNSDLGSEKVRDILKKENLKIFFIGVLGAGMLPLAELMAERGACVFGNDRKGCGQKPQYISSFCPLSDALGIDLAVYSLAISEDDKDVALARERGIPLVSRAELLGAVMSGYPIRIGVSGSHGKSTTVAMLDTVLRGAGMHGVTLSGADLTSGGALKADGGDFFVYEACEYKNSFLKTYPSSVIITNIELDHTDFFSSIEDISRSFLKFADSADGFVVISERGAAALPIISKLGKKVYTAGGDEFSDFRYEKVDLSDTGGSFDLYFLDRYIGSFGISALGEHNVRNAVAALAVAYLNGVDIRSASNKLAEFRGIGRRQELLGYINDRAVYYDYAHHPTEIECTHQALRAKEKSLVCIFKPHTYSRTASLFNEFRDALSLFDNSVILDIYPAREDPIPGVDAAALARAVGDRCVYRTSEECVNYCLQNTSGAIVLMGAGEVDDIRDELLALINQDNLSQVSKKEDV